MSGEERNEFQEALGVYVGPVGTAEAVAALAAHPEWVALLGDESAGEIVLQGHGWNCEDDENDERFVFTLARTEQGAGNPAVYVRPKLVLSFNKSIPLTGGCDQYTGGLVFKLGFGDYKGHTLTLLAWHSVLHETESGDLAPGFGPLASAEIVALDDDESQS